MCKNISKYDVFERSQEKVVQNVHFQIFQGFWSSREYLKIINEFIQFSHDILQKNNIEYLLFGHLGDCHLHFHVIYTKEETPIINNLYRKIIQKSAELDGVYSAEHGTGKRKTIDFFECYGQRAIDQVEKCKLSFDPNNILNTGNIITIKDTQ